MSEHHAHAERWRPFTRFALQLVLPQDQEMEFLALQDIPSSSIRRGDIVRGKSVDMPLNLFSHWRPIADPV